MGMGCENRKGKIAGYRNLVLSWLKIYLRWLKENGSLVYTAFVVKLWVSKGSKACQILPIITFVCCSSFPVLLFSLFSSLGKRYQITEVRRSCTYLHWFLFCWRIWPFLLLPGRTCRTWTILWTERLLSKSGHGMATPELMTMTSGQWRQYGRNHKLGGSVLRKRCQWEWVSSQRKI